MPDWVAIRCREIGERIRDARSAARLTQVQLGERIGRDHKTIHRYEAASRIPNLVDLLLIADATGTTVPELTQDQAGQQEGPAHPPRGERTDGAGS
jgi:transcriptional regulator with XRE-family HTH domain